MRKIPMVLAIMLLPAGAAAQWTQTMLVDQFGRETDVAAHSERASTIRPMAFPYEDLQGQIVVQCDSMWLSFTERPNLTGGFSLLSLPDVTVYHVDVLLDDQEVTWAVDILESGSLMVLTADGDLGITALKSSETVSVALPWFQQGPVAFQWSLDGAAEAIAASCGPGERDPTGR